MLAYSSEEEKVSKLKGDKRKYKNHSTLLPMLSDRRQLSISPDQASFLNRDLSPSLHIKNAILIPLALENKLPKLSINKDKVS